MAKPSERMKRIWEKKLLDSGFEDIEKEINGERVLRDGSAPSAYRSEKEQTREAKLAFYRMVSRKVSITSFPNNLEEQIMSAYAEGVTQADIKRQLEGLGIKMHRETLYEIIYQYLGKWSLKPYYKKWSPKRK